MNTRKLTYTGKSVYIGIDVHKKSYTFSAYCDGIICKTATVPANPESFAQNLKKWFPGGRLFSVYEAGFSGFSLHRTLESRYRKNKNPFFSHRLYKPLLHEGYRWPGVKKRPAIAK